MKRKTKACLLLPVWAAVIPAAAGWGVMLLWNAVLPGACGFSVIGFWEGVGLFLLGQLLSAGFVVGLLMLGAILHAVGHGRGHGRWHGMSDEQRREFMARRRQWQQMMRNRYKGNDDGGEK